MRSNQDWFHKQRAKGICYICKRPMRDDNPRLAHARCSNLQANRDMTYKQIQELLNKEDEERALTSNTSAQK